MIEQPAVVVSHILAEPPTQRIEQRLYPVATDPFASRTQSTVPGSPLLTVRLRCRRRRRCQRFRASRSSSALTATRDSTKTAAVSGKQRSSRPLRRLEPWPTCSDRRRESATRERNKAQVAVPSYGEARAAGSGGDGRHILGNICS